MAFNPLAEKGAPVDKQLRPWSQISPKPYDALEVDPYTRCRIILMNGIEVESILFSHQFNRHTDIPEVREKLAESRRVEAQQQKAVNWLIPGDESTLEVTLGFEQVAVDLTAWLARSEPDPYIKQTLDFGLLEDFDHLYRYAQLYEMLEHKKAEQVIGMLTEVMPGRPTIEEHRHPIDDLRRHYDKHTADPQSQLNVLTITAAEQQTMNWYCNVGNRYMEPIARDLYAEIAMIEEQHVTQYECLMDPLQSWFEQLVMHEYNECYLYHSFASQEHDERVRKLWEQHLDHEIGQLHVACDLLKRYDGKEPEAILPAALPDPVLFEPNMEYVRNILATQLEMTTDKVDFGASKDGHPRYGDYQAKVHDDHEASEAVVDQHREQFGSEYRIETEGPSPAERLREDGASVAAQS